MCLTRQRKRLKISPGYRLRGKRIMVFSVYAENEQKSESGFSFANSELGEISHVMNCDMNYT